MAAAAYAELRFHDAIAAVVGVSSLGNRFFDEVAPWTAFKKVCVLLFLCSAITRAVYGQASRISNTQISWGYMGLFFIKYAATHAATHAVTHAATLRSRHYSHQTPSQGSDEDKAAAVQHLVSVLEAVRVVAVMLAPVTPALSAAIHAQLGYDEHEAQTLLWSRDVQWGGLPQGRALPKPSPVFVRLDGDFVTELAAKKQPAVAT